MATPNANQAPQGAGTSPRSPLVAMGGLWGCQKSENRPVATSMPRLGVPRVSRQDILRRKSPTGAVVRVEDPPEVSLDHFGCVEHVTAVRFVGFPHPRLG